MHNLVNENLTLSLGNIKLKGDVDMQMGYLLLSCSALCGQIVILSD